MTTLLLIFFFHSSGEDLDEKEDSRFSIRIYCIN